MEVQFEYKGYWFLPDNPENKIAGVLYFKPKNSITLELIGGFKDEFNSWQGLDANKKISIIHGETSDAKRISLISCHQFGSYNFSCSFSLVNFSVEFIIEGLYLKNADEAKFDCLKAELPLLDQWINSYKIAYTTVFDKHNKSESVSLKYSILDAESIQAKIDEKTIIKFEFGCKPPEKIGSEMTLKQLTFCSINLKEKSSFQSLLSKLYSFKSFLSLATLFSIDIISLVIFSESVVQELNTGEEIKLPIKLYYLQSREESITNKKFKDFLFDYQKIQTIFPDIINKWYDLNDDLFPIRNHLVESIKPINSFTSTNFLIVIQALDGFCMRFRNGDNVRKFKDRLVSIYNEFDKIQVIKNFNINFDQAVDSRDYFSHFLIRGKKKDVIFDVELYKLTEKLRVLLVCCVLSEIGFDHSLINEIVNHDKF